MILMGCMPKLCGSQEWLVVVNGCDGAPGVQGRC